MHLPEGTFVFTQVLMGLSLFLFGMSRLEVGIQTLGYAAFKRWLIRSTESSLGSVTVGIGVTAILQSSSMVSLLVLAFASAGVLPLLNAVGILLGANLGTTVTGWMVATVGFKLSLKLLALPLMAGGAALQIIPGKRERLTALGSLVFGFGLLIFGLDLMKAAVEEIAQTWDLAVLRGHGLWLYFIAGAGIAALIQSSSATMMMTLAALHGGLFDLQSAAALVIGADLGTTSTTALGSIGGHYVKRQLALAHVIFNLVVDSAAFFFLLPMLPWLIAALGVLDPLYALVAFHSVFNIVGLLVFVPLLRPYSNWVGRRFTPDHEERPALLGLPADVPDAALIATARLLDTMRAECAVLALHSFALDSSALELPESGKSALESAESRQQTLEQRYHDIKHMESELLAFSMDLQSQALTPDQVSLLSLQGEEARAIVASSKALKDVRHNLSSMGEHPLADVVQLYQTHREFLLAFYQRYWSLPLPSKDGVASARENELRADGLRSLWEDNEGHMQEANNRVRDIAASDLIAGTELSNLLNVNWEVHQAIASLLRAP